MIFMDGQALTRKSCNKCVTMLWIDETFVQYSAAYMGLSILGRATTVVTACDG